MDTLLDRLRYDYTRAHLDRQQAEESVRQTKRGEFISHAGWYAHDQAKRELNVKTILLRQARNLYFNAVGVGPDYDGHRTREVNHLLGGLRDTTVIVTRLKRWEESIKNDKEADCGTERN